MENIILIVHLIIALALIAVVLLQRSEGGALGMGGGGGGGGGVVSSRGAATALSKVTWGLAAAFIATSLTLTIIAAQGSGSRSIIDGVQTGVPSADEPTTPSVGGFTLPQLNDAQTAPTEPPSAD
ncbi:MAG: preprotein translocase subunit SecG [Pseudomonadota bacterium]